MPEWRIHRYQHTCTNYWVHMFRIILPNFANSIFPEIRVYIPRRMRSSTDRFILFFNNFDFVHYSQRDIRLTVGWNHRNRGTEPEHHSSVGGILIKR